MIQRDEQRYRSTAEPGHQSAFGEVGVRVDQDFELAEHADQKVCKVPVDNSGQVGPCALREV